MSTWFPCKNQPLHENFDGMDFFASEKMGSGLLEEVIQEYFPEVSKAASFPTSSRSSNSNMDFSSITQVNDFGEIENVPYNSQLMDFNGVHHHMTEKLQNFNGGGFLVLTCKVGIDTPKIEVRYDNFSVEGEAYVGSRALPTLLNATLNVIEGALRLVRFAPSNRRKVIILKDISGIVKPSRYTFCQKRKVIIH